MQMTLNLEVFEMETKNHGSPGQNDKFFHDGEAHKAPDFKGPTMKNDDPQHQGRPTPDESLQKENLEYR